MRRFVKICAALRSCTAQRARAIIAVAMRYRLIAAIACALLAGCMPSEITQEMLKFKEDTPARRQVESRSFATANEAKLLTDGAAVLKELGFTVDVRSDELGFVAASKKGCAYYVGEIAAAAATVIVSQVVGLGLGMPAYDKNQSLRAALVAAPGDGGALVIRVTLQRVVWDTEGKVTKSELVSDPAPYKEFFAKLAKAAGLEAHEL